MLYWEMYKLIVSEFIMCNLCVDRCDIDFLWYYLVVFFVVDIDLLFFFELEKCILVSFVVYFDIFNLYICMNVNYLWDMVYILVRDDKEWKFLVNIFNVYLRIL